MNDQKNTLLAILLSGLVLIGWQYFLGLPQYEKQRQQQQLQQQAQQQPTPGQPTPGQPAPGQAGPGAPAAPGAPTPPAAPPGGPQVPGQPAPGAQPREAVIAASPRVTIDTPRLKGSIALKGARIDDLSLAQYRVTVDPNSPPVVLLSPSGSPHPFYAEVGW